MNRALKESERVFRETPAELIPIVGVLHYGKTVRAKILIAGLTHHFTERIEKPNDRLYRHLEIMTREKVHKIFNQLDKFLRSKDHYQALGSEVESLVTTSSKFTDTAELKPFYATIKSMPDVKNEEDAYLKARKRGHLTCFYCAREVYDEGGDSSSEYGIYYACDQDWRNFDNPDGYLV